MDHDEAVREMMAERYLLDELSPELCASFEEHAFDCPNCALDLRTGSAFIEAAKAELPNVTESVRPDAARERPGSPFWSFWLRPAFVVPAFALLLLVIAFQNFSTIPSLRSSAGDPRILPSAAFHAGTRGAGHTPVRADREQGVVLSIELPRDPAYASYNFTLYDPENKQQWTRTITAKEMQGEEGTVSLFIPGQSLRNGSYTLAIAGITDQGGRTETKTEIDRRVLDIQLAN
jgi:hypothetical protein